MDRPGGGHVRRAPRRIVVPPGTGHPQAWTIAGPPVGDDDPGQVLQVAPHELAAVLRRVEEQARPRWVWARTGDVYPAAVAAGVRLARCHDLAATERLLLAHEQRWPELAALAPPADLPATGGEAGGFRQEALFGSLERGGVDPGPPEAAAARPGATVPDDAIHGDTHGSDPVAGPLAAAGRLAARDRDQRNRLTARARGRLDLLVAAESAGALLAVEMRHDGLPWDVAAHEAILTDLLGPRPRHGRPARLQALADEVAAALDDPGLNPDSPADLLRSLRRAGLPVTSTNRHELGRHEHPVIPPLRRYKELARLWTAHGWLWRETWVRDGRFHPEYVPGGVISGRWATRGGGALQIPRSVRGAVRAGPGWTLVTADAGQLEPRVLAALSADPGMIAATRAGDLYADLAARALGSAGARAQAKLALLSAMYGGGSAALGPLRRQFPRALALLEDAAQAGADGAGVTSVLGRRCPPAAAGWLDGLSDAAARERTRARGRFTRNFVVQASAADWAAVWIAALRRRLAALGSERPARLVFFQHDEVIVEARRDLTAAVVEAVAAAGEEATDLVLGDAGVRIPLAARSVSAYSDKG